MLRHRLTAKQWNWIADVLPERKRTGRPPCDRRWVMDRILRSLRADFPRRELSDAFGSWAVVWDLRGMWNHDSTRQAMLDRVRRSRESAQRRSYAVSNILSDAINLTLSSGRKWA